MRTDQGLPPHLLRMCQSFESALTLVRYDQFVADAESSPHRFSHVAALAIAAIQKARRR